MYENTQTKDKEWTHEEKVATYFSYVRQLLFKRIKKELRQRDQLNASRPTYVVLTYEEVRAMDFGANPDWRDPATRIHGLQILTPDQII